MSYLEVKQDIQQGKTHSLYFFHGTETYIIDDLVHDLLKQSLSEEERDFNLSIYDMRETPVELAIEEAETLPFFGEKRVVVLKHAFFLTGQKTKEKVEHDLKRFESYVENPSPDTVFVVAAPYEKIDNRKKVVKRLKANGAAVEAVPLSEGAMKKWLENIVTSHERSIDKEAMEMLIQLTGADLLTLVREIEKLSLYCTERIAINDVQMLTPRSLEENVFTLIDQAAKGQIGQAMQTFYDLLKQNEEPIRLVALFARQFRMMLHVKELSTRGYSQQKMASVLRVHPYAVKVAATRASSYSKQTLEQLLVELAEVDETVKTGKVDKKLALELFILKLKPQAS
ncbi:DNA polymerase III subunit delta [Salsuginibacillus kocurii]|uniref:DNA polymerase III subunit delta n=1 Tax=Salsuginibacillus kocurii TaxID=427078 RepID=UPI00035C2B6C|nr:DNA polymerase III subunit delta [Salsuginibacillus kocurii]